MNKITQLLLIFFISSIFFVWYTFKKSRYVPIKNDIVIIGTNAEYPPFTFIDNDQIVGFDIDLVREVVKRLGKTMELKDIPFDALIPEIQLGKVHIIAAGMTPTEEKAQQVLFTKPYLSGDPLVIISLAKNPPIHGVEDLYGKEVVVNEGYTADLYMSTIEGPILKRLSAPPEAFLELKSGRSYAFVIAQSAAKPFFDQYGKKDFSIVTIEGTTENYSLVISKRCPELLPQVQHILDTMEKDGTLKELKQKWGLIW